MAVTLCDHRQRSLKEPALAKAKLSKKVVTGAKAKAKPVVKAKASQPSSVKKAPKSAKTKPSSKPVAAKAGKSSRGNVKSVVKAPDVAKASVPPPVPSAPTRRSDGWMGPLADKPLPRATKLPPEGTPLNKRELEQALTVGMRGVVGEGSLKGRLIVYQGFPYLEVIGRDKRELFFLLQGPDQEVLPAYADHRVSITGLIRRNHNYGGSVDVRKYAAKKPGHEVEESEPTPDESRLRLLSPGEIEMIGSPGMGVGVRGFARLRGTLEMSGEDYYLVVSNSGTRQQVSFVLSGKGAKALKRSVGEIVVATGIVEKQTAWGGKIETEGTELRAPDYPPVARDSIEVVSIEASGSGGPKTYDVKLNHGLSVKLTEKQGFHWAIEPQTAKRVSLRECNLVSFNPTVREFFFTPRNPGLQEVDFFLGKTFNPMQVHKQFRILVNVKAPEAV
jgi:hypothetical protein